MLCFPHAKINLGLHILSRRPDGYHELETLFYPIGLSDALEIVPSETDAFHLSGIRLEGNAENNLVLKAYRALQRRIPLPPVRIYLHKAVPAGAGLGGGSSDGAMALKMLNSLSDRPLPDHELTALAASLGADCPFFLHDEPLLAGGIGDRFSPTSLSLKGYRLLLVKPPVHVATAEAYAHVTPRKPAVPLEEAIASPLSCWQDNLSNDFETSVFRNHPELKRLKTRLYELGARYAAMSGSGSALFGFFEESVPDAAARFPDCFVWEGECRY